MSFKLTRRRREGVIVLLAHLVVLAYVFQMFAFDHWRSPAPGASSEGHAAHCHGSAPGCAGIADTGSSLHVQVAPPIPPEARPGELDVASVTPESVSPAVSSPPPRSS